MNPDHDVVDRALSRLASETWNETTPNPYLEERLMQEFSKTPAPSRFARRPALAAALAIVVIGGGAFAATGGLEKIKNLFVTVEIEGRPTQLELHPVGNGVFEGHLETETADGKQANVRVRRMQKGPDGQQTKVHVNLTAPGLETEDVSEVAVGIGTAGQPDEKYTMQDIAGIAPAFQWINADGQGRALYLRSADEDNRASEIFSTTQLADGNTIVRKLATLPAEATLDGVTPRIEVDENDLITITWDNGADQRVIKLMDRVSRKALDPDEHVEVNAADGQVKVRFDQQGR